MICYQCKKATTKIDCDPYAGLRFEWVDSRLAAKRGVTQGGGRGDRGRDYRLHKVTWGRITIFPEGQNSKSSAKPPRSTPTGS